MKKNIISFQLNDSTFEHVLNKIGFYEQEETTTQEKECAKMLFQLGYFEKNK